MKFKTVREGQQAVILNHLGEGQLVVGPKRVFLFRKRFDALRHYSATKDQYLVIQDKDGSLHHTPGPCDIFFNFLLYEGISVENAIKLDANHVVVVYKRIKGDVQRRIVQGPAVFIPDADEWLHQFVWHGTNPDNKARMVPGSWKFNKLRIIPDQFYYNIHEVRTIDDTMITVKVMIFYTMVDILKMLDTTHDPIADIINALCADVISFISKLSYAGFVKETHRLSNIDTYPQLQHRTARIGFKVDKVVYRGYHASEQLQAMQNSAIESRTRLRLETEMEEQLQKLANFKLDREEARAGIKKTMELQKQQHQQKVEQLKQQHHLKQEQTLHAHHLEQASKETLAKLEHKKEDDEQKLSYLTNLSQLGVDVTKYLISQMDPQPTKQIRMMPDGYSSHH